MLWFMFIVILWMGLHQYSRGLGYFSVAWKSKTQLFNVKRDWDWRPKVSFMIPSYNESRVLCDSIESIMASDYPKELIEILPVDDCSSDDTWACMQEMQAKYPENVHASRNEVNQGKPQTLIEIVQRATGDIVFTVDSDTVIAPDAIREILSCYADPDIGGVGGQVRVRNLNESLWSQLQGIRYIEYFFMFKVLENQVKTNRCLCGPLASFRRVVFLEAIAVIRAREFLGVKPIRAGEDTYLTTQVALGSGFKKPWRLFINFKAMAWTNNPATFLAFHNQQLRWYRSGILNGLYAVGKIGKNVYKAGVIPVLITGMIFIGACILVPTLLSFWLLGWLPQFLATAVTGYCIYSMLFCLGYNYFLGRHDPIAGRLKNPILTGILHGTWLLVSFMLTALVSLWTMDDGGWVTRDAGHTNTR